MTYQQRLKDHLRIFADVHGSLQRVGEAFDREEGLRVSHVSD